MFNYVGLNMQLIILDLTKPKNINTCDSLSQLDEWAVSAERHSNYEFHCVNPGDDSDFEKFHVYISNKNRKHFTMMIHELVSSIQKVYPVYVERAWHEERNLKFIDTFVVDFARSN